MLGELQDWRAEAGQDPRYASPSEVISADHTLGHKHPSALDTVAQRPREDFYLSCGSRQDSLVLADFLWSSKNKLPSNTLSP